MQQFLSRLTPLPIFGQYSIPCMGAHQNLRKKRERVQEIIDKVSAR